MWVSSQQGFPPPTAKYTVRSKEGYMADCQANDKGEGREASPDHQQSLGSSPDN